MNVVGVDASLSSFGLAHVDGRLETIVPKAGADDRARRLDEIEGRFVRALRIAPPLPDLVLIEGYADHSPGIRSTIALAELGGMLRVALWRLGIPYVEIPPARLKRYATGMGNAKKPIVVRCAREAGATPANDDEADAFWLRHLGRAYAGHHSITEPHRLEIVAAIDWPTTRSTP